MPEDNNTAATIGFGSDLRRAADALRSNMDAACRVQARHPAHDSAVPLLELSEPKGDHPWHFACIYRRQSRGRGPA
jgi:hypothetical protein